MILLINLVIAVIFLFLFYYYLSSRRKYKLAPGPVGFPIIGNILSVGPRPHMTFEKWGKKYGSIIGAKFGFTDVLILTDPKIIREAFNNPVFSGRPDNNVLNVLSGGKHGIVNSDGQEWKEQSRFVMKTLRDFGFGKQIMERFIMEEVNEALYWMKTQEGLPISINKKWRLATVNSLWRIVAGKRHDHDDPIMNDVIDNINNGLAELANAGILQLFPELIDMLPNFLVGNWNIALKHLQPFFKILSDAINEHLENPADEQHPRDLIDAYLAQVKKTTDPDSSFYKDRGYKTLEAVIGGLYEAGLGTTSATLTWAVLYLIKFPKVQAKIQAELDEVIGKNRQPSLSDKTKLPYTEAVIMEIFRYSSIAPVGLFHAAMDNITFHGYHVKKGTMIIANLVSAHFNPHLWGDPNEFRPERFLSRDEKNVIKSKNMMAFSTGKRQCLGESLARDTLFLFLTSFYQNFVILCDPAQPNPTLEPELNFLQEAKIFSVILKDRLR